MNGVQTRFKCKLDVKRCKRFVFPPSSLLPRSNALKTKAIRYFQTDRTLTRIVSPPLNLNLRKGISVQLGDFGCFRPGMNCESQDTEKEVDSDTIRRVKIIFTPGYKFKEMLSKVSVQKAVASDDGSISPEQPAPNPDDGKGEAPDPAA